MYDIIRQYIPQFIASAIILLLIPLLKFILNKLIQKFMSKYVFAAIMTEARVNQMIKIINILINTTFIIALTVVWGVEPRNMLVALSSIFAVIGVALFAQWSLLSNVTAGIIIFFSMPFKVGDEISIMDKDLPIDAVVEGILTFSIHLRSKEGELIVLSNSIFLQKTIAVKDKK